MYAKSVATQYQFAGCRSPVLLRNRTINPNVTAPATILTEVNVAASIRSSANANRHNKELAAKANMAMTVKEAVRAIICFFLR